MSPESSHVDSAIAATDARRPTHHRYADVDGVSVFFREAGPMEAPVVLLLHGFPTSSRMYRDLIPALSDQYRVIAPDYPGFGHSAVPDRRAFDYGFAAYAAIVDGLLQQMNVERCAIYVQDFGAPVGFRLALLHPERISAVIVQNGNTYEEGLGEFFAPLFAYWKDPTPEHRDVLRSVLTLDATRWQYLEGVSDPARIDPDNWVIDHALLQRAGVDEIMLDVFYDYRTNLSLYPRFQAFLRERQPPGLILWGENDVIFPAVGAYAFPARPPGRSAASPRLRAFRVGGQEGGDRTAGSRISGQLVRHEPVANRRVGQTLQAWLEMVDRISVVVG